MFLFGIHFNDHPLYKIKPQMLQEKEMLKRPLEDLFMIGGRDETVIWHIT